MVRVWLRAWAPPVVAVGAALLLACLALLLGGHDPIRALTALWDGALGTPERFFSISLVRATPLLLSGLAVALAFRGGIWNIGAEGQIYAGAIAATATALALPELPRGIAPLVAGLAGLAAGGLCASLPAWLRLRSDTNEVISTLLMNFLMLQFVSLLVRGPLQESRGVFPQSDPVPDVFHLPTFGAGQRFHAGFLVAVALTLLLALILRRTNIGLRIRAMGSAPRAASLAGRINVGRGGALLLIASGALAGLAGAIEVTGVTYALYEDLSPGWGYTAIAVALLGGLRPLGVLGAAVFLGSLEGGAGAMQRSAGVPAVWVVGIEALLILAVILATQWAGRAWGASR